MPSLSMGEYSSKNYLYLLYSLGQKIRNNFLFFIKKIFIQIMNLLEYPYWSHENLHTTAIEITPGVYPRFVPHHVDWKLGYESPTLNGVTPFSLALGISTYVRAQTTAIAIDVPPPFAAALPVVTASKSKGSGVARGGIYYKSNWPNVMWTDQ